MENKEENRPMTEAEELDAISQQAIQNRNNRLNSKTNNAQTIAGKKRKARVFCIYRIGFAVCALIAVMTIIGCFRTMEWFSADAAIIFDWTATVIGSGYICWWAALLKHI